MVVLLNNRIKAIINTEGVGVAGRAANQGVVALATVQRAGVVGRTLDDIVATIATFDTKDLLNIIDAQEAAIGEFEQLNTINTADELILNPEGVVTSDDRDKQVVDVLCENNVIAGDVGTKFDDIVHRDMDAAPVAPGGAQALINNDVIVVADIELIGVATITTHQEIIAAAPVEGFTEVGTGDRLAGIGTVKVDVFRIEVCII